MKTIIFAAITALAATVYTSGSAHAADRYLSFDIVGGTTSDEFGGFNTLGGFSNRDEHDDTHIGLSLSYGLRDYATIGGIRITPELELAWFDEYSTTSASFPGLPAPVVFYTSSVQTARLGGNVWWPVSETTLWRTEIGLGAGLLYRDISTSDGVVAGSSDDFTGYGQIGLRALRSVGDRGNLKVGVNYVMTGETDAALAPIGGGAPAGDLSVNTRSLELRLGYEFKLN